jgi:hypothetical protein
MRTYAEFVEYRDQMQELNEMAWLNKLWRGARAGTVGAATGLASMLKRGAQGLLYGGGGGLAGGAQMGMANAMQDYADADKRHLMDLINTTSDPKLKAQLQAALDSMPKSNAAADALRYGVPGSGGGWNKQELGAGYDPSTPKSPLVGGAGGMGGGAGGGYDFRSGPMAASGALAGADPSRAILPPEQAEVLKQKIRQKAKLSPVEVRMLNAHIKAGGRGFTKIDPMMAKLSGSAAGAGGGTPVEPSKPRDLSGIMSAQSSMAAPTAGSDYNVTATGSMKGSTPDRFIPGQPGLTKQLNYDEPLKAVGREVGPVTWDQSLLPRLGATSQTVSSPAGDRDFMKSLGYMRKR